MINTVLAKARKTRYREKNREALRIKAAEYNAEHHDEQAKYHAEHRGEDRARTARWKSANPQKALDTKLKSTYGITLADRDAMLTSQGGRCANAGCRADISAGKNRFHIDHDHVTGRVRALLCGTCNTALGMLGDGLTNDRIFGLYEYAVEHGPKLIGSPNALFELRPTEQRNAA